MTWRDVLPVHPAADLFPLMSEVELRELAEDVKVNSLRDRVAIWTDSEGVSWLLDGRNRLDALELIGELSILDSRPLYPPHRNKKTYEAAYSLVGSRRDFDPYAYVLSKNVHRRHLTAEQKRDLIEKLLKAKPEASDRTIAKQTKVDHKTVGKARAELEGRGDIPHVENRTDSKGRQQPATKPKAQEAIAAQTGDVDIETRKAEMAVLDLTPEQREAKKSAEALSEFKFACNTYLPRLNKADAAQARVFFNEWTAKAVKAEAKAKASETAS